MTHPVQVDAALGRASASGPTSAALAVQRTSAAVAESVALLDGGDQAYPRMLMAIGQARRSIDLEVYAFSPTGVGARFIDALGAAAARGVHVRVVVDGWGSARRGRAVTDALRAAGCTASVFHRLRALLVGRFGRNHRKMLLVDDEVAFLGGINIGDENVGDDKRPGWADLALEIRGPECARLGAMIRREPPGVPRGSLRVYLCGLGGGFRLRRHYLESFANARESIHIAHGYFLPDRGVVRAIVAAARRGVRVRLLLAGRSDVPFARAAMRSLHRQFTRAGVSIYEWSGSVLHAKVATIDGQRLLVGSFNLDPFSLTNLESLVVADDGQVATQAEAWIHDHAQRSRLMAADDAGLPARTHFIDPLGRAVARLVDAIARFSAKRARRVASKRRSAASAPHRDGSRTRAPGGR